MFQTIITWLKGVGTTLFENAKKTVAAVEPEAAAAFDALVTKYTPLAIQLATTAETAFTSSTDKQGSVFTGLGTQLELDGKNLEADGVTGLINLLVEIGASFVNISLGQQAK